MCIDKKKQSQIMSLLEKDGVFSIDDSVRVEQLSGDGSDRIFYRIKNGSGKSIIAVFPSPTMTQGFAEQISAFRIGVHLFDKNVVVPDIFAFDKEHGLLLFEDLGNVNLQSMVRNANSLNEVEGLYYQAIEGLIAFQLDGIDEFDSRFCWDTPFYDKQMMLERESGYFSQAFCRDYMGKIPDDPRLPGEFLAIAHRAAQEPNNYLLHRDFQSRNLMVYESRVRIIDFQGARIGPLGYDLASMLLDPYVELTDDFQAEMFNYYIECVSRKIALDRIQFAEGYFCLSLQRNLQIVGAFAFLSQVKGKIYFEQFMLPAVYSLQTLLSSSRGNRYPALTSLVDELVVELEKVQKMRIEK
jgi:N-acetylmuramate 1-kinase